MESEIYEISVQNRASKRVLMWVGEVNGFLLKLGEDGRLGKGGHMEDIEPTPNSNCIEFVDGLVTLEG